MKCSKNAQVSPCLANASAFFWLRLRSLRSEHGRSAFSCQLQNNTQ